MTKELSWMVAFAAAVVMFPGTRAEARDADPYAASTKTCQAVINDDVKSEFPKARGVEWQMNSVLESDIKGGVRLVGSGTYKGDSGKRRTYEFECRYDKKENKVVHATWESSWDHKTYTVVDGGDMEMKVSASDITRACKKAVDDLVRNDFEHKIQKIELVQDSVERKEKKGVHHLAGQARFLGGGGNWHRFEFTCDYDEDDEEVIDTTWRHLGDESNMDFDDR